MRAKDVVGKTIKQVIQKRTYNISGDVVFDVTHFIFTDDSYVTFHPEEGDGYVFTEVSFTSMKERLAREAKSYDPQD